MFLCLQILANVNRVKKGNGSFGWGKYFWGTLPSMLTTIHNTKFQYILWTEKHLFLRAHFPCFYHPDEKIYRSKIVENWIYFKLLYNFGHVKTAIYEDKTKKLIFFRGFDPLYGSRPTSIEGEFRYIVCGLLPDIFYEKENLWWEFFPCWDFFLPWMTGLIIRT